MKMNNNINNVVKNFNDGQKFTIATNNSIFETLSKRLYTNPIRAIIRELLSNAIDANISAGVESPVKVHLPSTLEPTFYIKDTGIGMTEEEVMNIYTQYGNSTKDSSNEHIGGLGLGSKTPFAYTSQFIIESAKNGLKNTYICFLDEGGLPNITKSCSEKSKEHGTKVEFAVEKDDISSFIYQSLPIFAFSLQMPELLNANKTFFNTFECTLEDFEETRSFLRNEGFIVDSVLNKNKLLKVIFNKFSSPVIAIMGGIPYEVDLFQVFQDSELTSMYRVRNAIVNFNIGDLSIQASREKLNYTKDTIEKLRKKLINYSVKEVIDIFKKEENIVE